MKAFLVKNSLKNKKLILKNNSLKLKKKSGKNTFKKKTINHKGKGNKNLFRKVSFLKNKKTFKIALLEKIEYSPNRSSFLNRYFDLQKKKTFL